MREGDWKLVHLDIRSETPRFELYNLADDPGESTDVSAQHPKVVARLRAIMTDAHVPNPDFPVLKGE